MLLEKLKSELLLRAYDEADINLVLGSKKVQNYVNDKGVVNEAMITSVGKTIQAYRLRKDVIIQNKRNLLDEI